MRTENEIQQTAIHIETLWQTEATSHIDAENQAWSHNIEKEYYESVLLEMGYNETDIERVLQALGY